MIAQLQYIINQWNSLTFWGNLRELDKRQTPQIDTSLKTVYSQYPANAVSEVR